MARHSDPSCCVCDVTDARALVDVVLVGGARATLCGSHALIHRRSSMQARSAAELRVLLTERRKRSERRSSGDALADSLMAAFSGDRRASGRRRS